MTLVRISALFFSSTLLPESRAADDWLLLTVEPDSHVFHRTHHKN